MLAHYAMIRYEQQEGTVPEDASRYTAKRIVPPFLYGSKHCSTFSFFFMLCMYHILTQPTHTPVIFSFVSDGPHPAYYEQIYNCRLIE